MRKASHFAKVLWIPSRNAWQVRLNTGREKIYRKEFKDEEKANGHAAELNKNIPMEGATGVLFDAIARADYAAAKEILPLGISLLEAARFYVDSKRQRVTIGGVFYMPPDDPDLQGFRKLTSTDNWAKLLRIGFPESPSVASFF